MADTTEFGQCRTVCDGNITEVCQASDETVKLKFLTGSFGEAWVQPIAREFEKLKLDNGVSVEVEFVSLPFSQLFPDIVNEAISRIGVFDGFITPPSIAGSVVEYDGWHDLSSYIQESAENAADWSDILLGYRKWIAQYEGQVIMYPLDGDLFSMYYRKDVLEHFGLTVPRTWDEYSSVAEYVHGKEFDGQVLHGSCIGRVPNCAGAYWANLIVSSMTQSLGAWSGHLFDTEDMTPLTGEALVQALEWSEQQVRYGFEDEFTSCISPANSVAMKEGNCVLTYNWGNSFKTYLQDPSVLRGRLGVAPTPGSTKVLDRNTMELVDCDRNRCPYGTFYDDIGWVNRAPYMAFGGWACAVNNYTSVPKKRLATELCAYASNKENSIDNIIPNATAPFNRNGQDPYRASHLDLERFVAQGYERETAQDYIDAIQLGLGSENVVTDIRFPQASELMGIIEKEFHDHLNMTRYGEIPAVELPARRKAVCDSIETQWLEVIDSYNNQGTTQIKILDAYQRLRGVKNYDLNQINKIRGYGFALAGIVLVSALGFAGWTYYARRTNVVRASQPFFLGILCFGAFVLGSAIIPMGIDDSIVSAEGVGSACMAIPWLLALGWTVLFSALYSKLKRVNTVYTNSLKFKRIKVKVKDVMFTFCALLTWNICFLIVWTVVDPLKWKRVETSDTSSYGTCSADDSVVWKICASFIAGSNGITLVLANIQAYKARHMTTEFGESAYIAMAMGSILQVTLVGVPLIFLVGDNPSASYFVRSSIVFVISMSILFLVFVPKVYIWSTRPNESRSMSRRGNVGMSMRSGTGGNNTWQQTSFQSTTDASYRRRVVELERILREKGVETEAAFAQAGLSDMGDSEGSDNFDLTRTTSELRSSMVGAESLSRVAEEMDEGSSRDFRADEDYDDHKYLNEFQTGVPARKVRIHSDQDPNDISDMEMEVASTTTNTSSEENEAKEQARERPKPVLGGPQGIDKALEKQGSLYFV